MSAINRVFWQDKVGVPSVIREGPIPSQVGDGELLIKVRAWAMNPVNAYLQTVALPFFRYPSIPGEDVAGTVELVGSAVAASSKFKVGDRVAGLALGALGGGGTDRGGFQDFVVLDAAMAYRVPDALSFAEASVFPLCIATAAHALFSKDFLGLPYPQAAAAAPATTGKSVLVWGGASAVGCNAIQMARAAGFEVVTTCSPRNYEYVRALGASKAFDYTSPTVVDDVAAELDGGGACAGIFQAAGPFDAVAPCCAVAHRSRQDLFVACANAVPGDAVPEGVRARMVLSVDDTRPAYYDTTSVIFGGFLPEALASGGYKVAPRPEVVSRAGVDGIQEALDILREGVSAKKIVVVDE
ncbi:GroES-like protein [Hypoxylon rubiginosum]|uniref:GroES-like protein n=1 Tax=Hypoxylon rubiginosum TaxID=110542 RepID=A0ACB9YUF0_9PEZI|nr:GroES-like protein [Hypoxylon rubiginosum]